MSLCTDPDDMRADERLEEVAMPVIRVVPPANLRERLTRHAEFFRMKEDDEAPAHPTGWLVSAIDSRCDWPRIRPLMGLTDCPILRADGTVLQVPGYDKATGILYQSTVRFPTIGDRISVQEAHAARDLLLEAICDFMFEGEEHRSAVIAAILTGVCRHAFHGPSPLFLLDANTRAAGKSLLSRVIGLIALGHELPVSSYMADSQELRKQITAVALAGDRMVMFDNLDGTLGNDTLDRALTTLEWKDRILGRSEHPAGAAVTQAPRGLPRLRVPRHRRAAHHPDLPWRSTSHLHGVQASLGQ